MIWFLQDGSARVEQERRAIAELAESVSWLQIVGWRFDGVQLCVDADIVASEAVSFAVTLRYPDFFPHTPPSVSPRDDMDERWSEHQYVRRNGGASELCLEYGPDNWTTDLTGADLLVSAHRLLVGEEAEGGSPRPPVPSRHETTLGQDLRSAWLRFIVTPAFSAFAGGLPPGVLVPATMRSVWQRRSFMAVVGTARPAEAPEWTDPNVPDDLSLGRAGVILRLPEGDGGIDATSFTELCGILRDAGIDLASWVEAQEAFPEFMVLAAGDRLAVRWRLDASKDELLRFETVAAPSDGGARVSPAYGELAGKKVALVGCGSAGSKIGVSLARSGVGHFVLVDDDVLLPGNLVRNEMDWRDVGGHKADVLADRLKLVNPAATADVRRLRLSAQEASGSAAAALSAVSDCDLIVDATVDPTVFNLLSSVVVLERKPLVWLEVFGGGYGGLMARHRPGIDPDPQSMRACVLDWCAKQGKSWPKGARDYETDGEGDAPLVADDADVGVIAAHAARLALDQLCGEQPSRFPHAIYLVGLSRGWIFEEPFDTVPIDVETGEKAAGRGPDPDEMKAGLEFVGGLVRRLLDEPAGSQ
ncbi:MAG: ThiF family adenylyltransferase [Alphaproteobacteria bacterium]